MHPPVIKHTENRDTFDLAYLEPARVQDAVPAVRKDGGQLSGFPPAADLVGRLRSGATVLGDVPHVVGPPQHLQGTEEQTVQPAQGEQGASGDDADHSPREQPGVAPNRGPVARGVQRVSALHQKHHSYSQSNNDSHFPIGHALNV